MFYQSIKHRKGVLYCFARVKFIFKTNEEAWAVYYTVIKHSGHDGHLRKRGKCRKHSPAPRVFYISRVFSNDRSVLSQCNTRLRFLYLLNNHAEDKPRQLAKVSVTQYIISFLSKVIVSPLLEFHKLVKRDHKSRASEQVTKRWIKSGSIFSKEMLLNLW